ncbi:PEP-utilizing enzyme [Desulfosporosinus sp. SB140]
MSTKVINLWRRCFLLSHTAIVAREYGIPAVVPADHVLPETKLGFPIVF